MTHTQASVSAPTIAAMVPMSSTTSSQCGATDVGNVPNSEKMQHTPQKKTLAQALRQNLRRRKAPAPAIHSPDTRGNTPLTDKP